jgi:hypothetical protein
MEDGADAILQQPERPSMRLHTAILSEPTVITVHKNKTLLPPHDDPAIRDRDRLPLHRAIFVVARGEEPGPRPSGDRGPGTFPITSGNLISGDDHATV